MSWFLRNYRQKFRSWTKNEKQTNVEFGRDLLRHFNLQQLWMIVMAYVN